MALLERGYYWEKIKMDVVEYIKTYLVCQQYKEGTIMQASPLQPFLLLEIH